METKRLVKAAPILMQHRFLSIKFLWIWFRHKTENSRVGQLPPYKTYVWLFFFISCSSKMMKIINIKTPDTGRKQNVQICIDKRINKIFIHTPKLYAQTYIAVKSKHKTMQKLMTPALKIVVISSLIVWNNIFCSKYFQIKSVFLSC